MRRELRFDTERGVEADVHVVRQPTDGRRVIVSPTAKGRRTVDQIMPAFNHHEALVTADLSPTDRQELARLLRTVLRTLDTDGQDVD